MATSFRNALVWHLARHNTKIADLVRRTGVSRDVINKLKKREESSTTPENALLIAAYYGKTLEQFIRCDDDKADRPLLALVDLLTPDEEALLAAQVRGLISERGQR